MQNMQSVRQRTTLQQIFEAMDDAYMQGRAADVRDVSERLLQALSSQNETVMVMDEPCDHCGR